MYNESMTDNQGFEELMQQAQLCLLKIEECQFTASNTLAKLGETVAAIKQHMEATEIPSPTE